MKTALLFLAACLCATAQTKSEPNPRLRAATVAAQGQKPVAGWDKHSDGPTTEAPPTPLQRPATPPASATTSAAPVGPTPIPADRQESVSREMLAYQEADLDLKDATILEQSAKLAFVESTERRKDAEQRKAAAQSKLNAIKVEYHAQGYTLTHDKQWQKPKQ